MTNAFLSGCKFWGEFQKTSCKSPLKNLESTYLRSKMIFIIGPEPDHFYSRVKNFHQLLITIRSCFHS